MPAYTYLLCAQGVVCGDEKGEAEARLWSVRVEHVRHACNIEEAEEHWAGLVPAEDGEHAGGCGRCRRCGGCGCGCAACARGGCRSGGGGGLLRGGPAATRGLCGEIGRVGRETGGFPRRRGGTRRRGGAAGACRAGGRCGVRGELEGGRGRHRAARVNLQIQALQEQVFVPLRLVQADADLDAGDRLRHVDGEPRVVAEELMLVHGELPVRVDIAGPVQIGAAVVACTEHAGRLWWK